jgi:hypothetical protein
MSFTWLKKIIRKPTTTRRRPVRRRGLRLELLEDRTMPAFFTPPTSPVGSAPVAQAVGDFNGDGKQDLAVVNEASNTVSVLLGNGNGTFQPKTDYATGATPMGVAIGDFNGDGKADLIVVNKGANSLSLLLGNGDGTFQPKTDIALPTSLTPVAVTVGDFNADGHADLAVSTHNTSQDEVTILLGNGNGTFQLPVSTVTDTEAFIGGITIGLAGGGPSSIVSGDFNGDGRTDLAVVNNRDIIVVTAVGRFGTILSTAVAPEPGSVSVLLSNGDGSFQAPRNFTVGSGAGSIAIGDFNNDGRLDLAVNSTASNSVSVLTNTGGGSFSTATLGLGNGEAGAPAAGDFNGDGITDLAVPTTTTLINVPGFSGVKVFDGQAGVGLQAAATYVQRIDFPVVGDFNGDGHPDLIGVAGNTIEPWLNNGDGTFPIPKLVPVTGVTFAAQATGDFNGDGIPDLVTASTGQVQLGLGDGRFGDPTTLSAGSTVAAVDADGNGTVDVLVSNPAYPTGQVAEWLNSPGYDNRTGGAVGFTISAPTQVAAGANVSVTGTAVDALGNPVPGFLGTVDLDNTPAGSTALNLSGQYTFTAADNGRHTFLFSNLTQAGATTLSTFAVGMPTVTAGVTVTPAAPAKFVIAAPASVTAGTPFAYTVTAEDTFGNLQTGYIGTVHFTASAADSQAVLPADYAFTAADAGVHTFTTTLFRTQSAIAPTAPSITATETTAHFASTVLINVLSLAPSGLAMFGVPSGTAAGSAMSVTVAALDIYGNAATAYTGAVHFSSSDAEASLPADYTITAADRGAHTFPVTLKTAGMQSLSVTDTANPAFTFTAGVQVVPNLPSVWTFAGMPTTTTAGAAQTFTLIAQDAYGNLATNYRGTLSFSSSDSQASLPFDYTFTAADAGRHTFTVALRTAGTQSITVADIFGFAFPGTLSGITVTPAAAATVQLTGLPTATTAGLAQSFTVTLRDAFGNIATSYTGTVAFSSSDPIAALPASYTFTTADAGTHVFTAALKRAGTQSVTVTDTAASALTSTETGIVVSPAAVAQFAISGPTSVTKGVGFKITVTTEDAFGNLNTGYRGTVHLSSTDATGGTQNFTFSNNDNDVHLFSYTFNALGFQTITVVDTSNSSIIGSIVEDVLAQSGGGGGGGGGAA